jgi:hypothetical protein
LTNAFSKKWENHDAMTALYVAWYNWCRRHIGFQRKGQKVPPTTPAMRHGLTDAVWSLECLFTESAKLQQAA